MEKEGGFTRLAVILFLVLLAIPFGSADTYTIVDDYTIPHSLNSQNIQDNIACQVNLLYEGHTTYTNRYAPPEGGSCTGIEGDELLIDNYDGSPVQKILVDTMVSEVPNAIFNLNQISATQTGFATAKKDYDVGLMFTNYIDTSTTNLNSFTCESGEGPGCWVEIQKGSLCGEEMRLTSEHLTSSISKVTFRTDSATDCENVNPYPHEHQAIKLSMTRSSGQGYFTLPLKQACSSYRLKITNREEDWPSIGTYSFSTGTNTGLDGEQYDYLWDDTGNGEVRVQIGLQTNSVGLLQKIYVVGMDHNGVPGGIDSPDSGGMSWEIYCVDPIDADDNETICKNTVKDAAWSSSVPAGSRCCGDDPDDVGQVFVNVNGTHRACLADNTWEKLDDAASECNLDFMRVNKINITDFPASVCTGEVLRTGNPLRERVAGVFDWYRANGDCEIVDFGGNEYLDVNPDGADYSSPPVSTCTPTESPETSCNDGTDNDCDGLVDCSDSSCSTDSNCQISCSGGTITACQPIYESNSGSCNWLQRADSDPPCGCTAKNDPEQPCNAFRCEYDQNTGQYYGCECCLASSSTNNNQNNNPGPTGSTLAGKQPVVDSENYETPATTGFITSFQAASCTCSDGEVTSDQCSVDTEPRCTAASTCSCETPPSPTGNPPNTGGGGDTTIATQLDFPYWAECSDEGNTWKNVQSLPTGNAAHEGGINFNNTAYAINAANATVACNPAGNGDTDIVTYTCVVNSVTGNGVWVEDPVLRRSMDDTEMGYCASDTSCLVSVSAGCEANNYWDKDNYCSNGKWTSRTKMVADALFDIAVDNGYQDYKVYCDESVNTLFDDDNSGGYKYCALSSDGENVVIGTSIGSNASASGELESYLNSLERAYDLAYENLPSYEPFTSSCGAGSTLNTPCISLGTSRDLLYGYYDPTTKIMILSASDVEPGFALNIANVFLSFIGLKKEAPELEEFDRLYYEKKGSKMIKALYESIHNDSQKGTFNDFITVQYAGGVTVNTNALAQRVPARAYRQEGTALIFEFDEGSPEAEQAWKFLSGSTRLQ